MILEKFLDLIRVKPHDGNRTLSDQEWEALHRKALEITCENLDDTLYDLSELPADVRETLDHIKEIDTVDGDPDFIARMEEIQRYANERITAIIEDADPLLSFSEAAKAMEGDCDNYASLKMGMLVNAEFVPGDVKFQGALVKYEIAGKQALLGHSYVIVEIDNTTYLLDNNLDAPVELDENGHATGSYLGRSVNFQIEQIYYDFTGDSEEPNIRSIPPNPFAPETENPEPAPESGIDNTSSPSGAGV